MTITRDGKDYELTREELSRASQAYLIIQAKENVVPYAESELNTTLTEALTQTGVDAYVTAINNGCAYTDALDIAVNDIRLAIGK